MKKLFFFIKNVNVQRFYLRNFNKLLILLKNSSLNIFLKIKFWFQCFLNQFKMNRFFKLRDFYSLKIKIKRYFCQFNSIFYLSITSFHNLKIVLIESNWIYFRNHYKKNEYHWLNYLLLVFCEEFLSIKNWW